MMKKVLLSILLALLPILVSAEAVEIGGIWYNLIPKIKEAEVIRNPSVSQNEACYYGSKTIPKEVIYENETYSVTSIGNNAFRFCSNLTSVTIPQSVTSIGAYAFQKCRSLLSITIPQSVTSIGNRAFCQCSGLKDFIIPNSVKNIEEFAFMECTGLKSVIIPNSVVSIGNSAFYGCSALTSIIIPNSMTSINDGTFRFCSNLVSITIPNSVTTIGGYAFEGCSSLSSITIPNSVTSIGGCAFYGCSNLTSFIIPNSITTIEYRTFSGCKNLTSLTVPNSVTLIEAQAFSDCDDLMDVYCLAEELKNSRYESKGLYTSEDAFKNSYPQVMTLHVPASSLEKYRSTEPWSLFNAIVPLEDGDIQTILKCATPKINYANGKVSLSCETEDVEFISEVTVADAKKYYDSEFTLSQTYKITVYATKAGYENSDVATREIVIENGQASLFGDLNKDGMVNVADHVKLSDIIMNK